MSAEPSGASSGKLNQLEQREQPGTSVKPCQSREKIQGLVRNTLLFRGKGAEYAQLLGRLHVGAPTCTAAAHKAYAGQKAHIPAFLAQLLRQAVNGRDEQPLLLLCLPGLPPAWQCRAARGYVGLQGIQQTALAMGAPTSNTCIS